MSESDQAPSCHDFVAGLAEAGVTAAFISPGSRNTPITLALAASHAIRDRSVRDERSAGFMALGFGKATGRPAVVVCTSGSAATHYFPSIVEADQSATPMIVLTADRPTGLRGTFAPQTMDQSSLYGSHVKASVEIDVSSTGTRAEGIAVVSTASDGIPGPVHVNLPFDEPLTPRALGPGAELQSDSHTPASRPTHSIDHLVADRRVLIITGGFLGVDFPALLGEYADALGAPVLADIQSRPDAHSTIAGSDVLASAGELRRNPPDVVIRFGGLPTSKPIWQWLSETEVPQVLVHHSRLTDPLGSANDVIDQHPVSVVSRLPEVSADRSYLTSWADADGVVRTVLERELAGTELSEPFVARATVEHAQPGSVVFVGSSMPIRDLDSYGIARREVTVIGNRGVNGIDGTISTALGCAIAGTPTTVLLGDIAALHDVSALAEVVTSAAPLRVVVINNDGGGIFSFLPQRQSGAIPHDVYEKHWGTPHGLSLSLIAEAMGLQAKTVMSVDALVEVLATHVRPELIEIHTERDANVERHRAIQIEVETALGSRQ